MGKTLIIALIVFVSSCGQQPEIKSKSLILSPLFSDGMVLQQKENVAFWGESAPNQKIRIKSSWRTSAEAIADDDGQWKTSLTTPVAGGPYEVSIESETENKTIKDVLIGEVWLAAGQSNMEMDFAYCCNTTDHSAVEIATANFPQIRMLNVEKQLSKAPTKQFEGSWEKAVGENITDFSAAAYFFAKRLHNELKVPIGIIHSSWGGTDAEAWTSSAKLSSLDFFEESLEVYDSIVNGASKSEDWFSQFESIKIPSDIWYLFLGDTLGFPDKWENLDFKDESYVSPNYDAGQWEKINLPGAFDNIFETNDFDGVILVKKTVVLDKIKGDYSIHLGPVSNMDFTYVNGKKIGATLGKASGEDKVYKIPNGLLKPGENSIVIRILNQYGEGTIGNVILKSSEGYEQSLAGKWSYSVSAEAYRQMDAFVWPYSSFYLYNKENIDFSERPPIEKYHQNVKSALYNGMIYPLIPYNIKGAIWYQGENNVQRFKEYERLFPAMIMDWRERWGEDFPFYFVQIAPFYNYSGLSSSLRDAQRKTLKVPKTGMVVTLDIGENLDIHPSNKHDVGNRLAGLALADNYGGQEIASGPLYKGHEIRENKIFANFDYIGSGLIFKENAGEDLGFEIAENDEIFVSAKARVLNDGVEIFSPDILKPMYIRYAWQDTAKATLFNMEGLPASSFSSN